MALMKKVECLGGPLDGSIINVDEDDERMYHPHLISDPHIEISQPFCVSVTVPPNIIRVALYKIVHGAKNTDGQELFKYTWNFTIDELNELSEGGEDAGS